MSTITLPVEHDDPMNRDLARRMFNDEPLAVHHNIDGRLIVDPDARVVSVIVGRDKRVWYVASQVDLAR